MIGIIKVYGGMLLAGLGQTLLLTLLALIIAMVIGMIFGLMEMFGHNRVLNLIGTVYVDAVTEWSASDRACILCIFWYPCSNAADGNDEFPPVFSSGRYYCTVHELRSIYGRDYPCRY